MIYIKSDWSKAILLRPRDNITSHVHFQKPRNFKPSYETNGCPINMNLLLGWEYARIWQKERDEFVQRHERMNKPKFIKNNYEVWLKKRKPKMRKS